MNEHLTLTQGPAVRTDLVDVYIYSINASGGLMLLHLRRALNDRSMPGQWHPIMGHTHAGESALQTALRELREETGLSPEHPRWMGLWQLEQVHPFFMADTNQVLLSPRLAARVQPGWAPTLNHEHDAWRWVDADHAHQSFLWPGQVASVRELALMLAARPTLADSLRLA